MLGGRVDNVFPLLYFTLEGDLVNLLSSFFGLGEGLRVFDELPILDGSS